MPYFPTYVKNVFVFENSFRQAAAENARLPRFKASRSKLPEPFWGGHASAIACYWKTWEIAFQNLRRPTRKNGFGANYIDTAFNNCLFMWDSAFIVMFASYGRRAFNFQATLDNLYAKQHPDGFISREIREISGEDQFERFDPASTGPNILPWSEWEYYLRTGDRDRLARVFPPLLAYYQWMRAYRTWRDGTYWSSGWGCGMDNQPRMDESRYSAAWSPARMVWLDACLQAVYANRILQKMAGELDRLADVDGMQAEAAALERAVNTRLWDERDGYYHDQDEFDVLVPARSVGAYWALLAGCVPPERLDRFIEHLRSPAEMNRPHRVPSLSADHPAYEATGGYWRGAVWAPTNYMVLRGLDQVGEADLAYEIACNHLDNVLRVFEDTGTVWENYAPETAAPGQPAKGDFVGWTGLPPVAVLFEYIFGIRPSGQDRLIWDVRRLEEHGIHRYPFGRAGTADLHCAARLSPQDKPVITVRADRPLEVEVRWDGGAEVLQAEVG